MLSSDVLKRLKGDSAALWLPLSVGVCMCANFTK